MTPRDFQVVLDRAGYAPGPADGIFGPRTRAAAEWWFRKGENLLLGEKVPASPAPVNRDRFYRTLRAQVGSLTQQQVDGINAVLDEWEARGWTNVNQLAYMLATAWWETNKTMAPVREAYWMSEDWRRRNLRYWPYYGRGLVQLTWPFNYQKAGEVYGVNLLDNPDLALDPDLAVRIMFDGMEQGWFTGKSLDDYIDEIDEPDSEDLREYKEARRIINGTDKAATIADLALKFERSLRE